VAGLSNENTSPHVVSPGTRVKVEIPVSMQSFFGYHEVSRFSLDGSQALLPDGSREPIELGDPGMSSGGRKPGKTDLIPLMEMVEPRASVTVPADPRLRGAIIGISVSGTLDLIPEGSRQVSMSKDYQAAATFRVAREAEVEFSGNYLLVSERLSTNVYMSFIVAALVLLGILIFSPSTPAVKPVETPAE
jgi:hypothetical protein